MGQLTQTTAQVQVILDDADAANVGKTSLTDSTDTTAVAVRKSGFYSLGASSSNAPSTDRAILISAVRDTTATGEIRYGQVAITESNGMWWNRDDGGTLGTWYEAVSTAGTQTLTNKTLTSPVLTTPQINDTSADHQYVFAVSELAADRTVTLPLLTGNDTFVFEAHTQTLTNKTLTSPVFNTGVSGTAVLDDDTFATASSTTLATSESIKAYVDTKVTGEDLDFAGDSGTGAVDLDSQTFTIAGTANEIETAASSQTLTIGLPDSVTITTALSVDTINEKTAAAGVTVDSLLIKDGGITAGGTSTFAGQTISDLGTVTTANIDGGSIDGTTIGASTAAAITGTTGQFDTSLNVDGTVTADGVISEGNITVDGDGNTRQIGFDFYGSSKYNFFVDGSTDADRMTIRKGTTTVAVFDSTGQVGIGAAPASELHVKGSTPDLRVENTTASETVSLSLIKTATKGFSINNKEISGTNYLTFNLDTAGAGTDAMAIHPTSGNVGIGGVPDTKLHLSDAGTPEFRLESTDTSVVSGQSLGDITWESNDVSGGGQGVRAKISALAENAGTIYGLAFYTGTGADPTEKFRIANDGSISTPTAGTSNLRLGVNAGNSIASGGNYNVVLGDEAGTALTTGDSNVFVGYAAGDANTSASNNTFVGQNAGGAVSTGALNTFVGATAGDAINEGDENVAIGYRALTGDTKGRRSTAVGVEALYTQNQTSLTYTDNVAMGFRAGFGTTTGIRNTLIGSQAGDALTDASSNVAIGYNSLTANTRGNDNVAVGRGTLENFNVTSSTSTYNTVVGHEAGNDLTTGQRNTLIGALAGDALTDGEKNTAVGQGALSTETRGLYSVAIGYDALNAQYRNAYNGVYNTAVGSFAGAGMSNGYANTLIGGLSGDSITTGIGNTTAGYNSLTQNVTGSYNTAIGERAGESMTGSYSTFVGHYSGQGTTGANNTFVGVNSGYLVTTGSKNTILGWYNGNQGGLDIRTSNNNIVLSDGDGNPRFIIDSNGRAQLGGTVGSFTAQLTIKNTVSYTFSSERTGTGSEGHVVFSNGNGAVGTIFTNGSATSYNTSSDHRLKENVVALTGATARLKQLAPKRFNFIADADDTTVDGFLAHEVQSVVPEAVTGTHNEVDDDGNPVYQGIDQSKLVPLLVATIQELEARIAALESN